MRRFTLARFSDHNLAAIAAVLCVLTGCAAVRLPEYSAQSSEQSLVSQTRDGLTVAVEIFNDDAKIEKYFGVNLLEKNVLPIFIFVKNDNSSSSVLLLKEKLFLNKPKNKELRQSTNTVSVPSSAGDGVAMAGAVLGSLPLLLIGGKMRVDGSAINHNLVTKELRSEAIPPGGKQQGFVYFQLDEKYNPAILYNVEMNLMNMNSRETLNLTFSSKLGDPRCEIE